MSPLYLGLDGRYDLKFLLIIHKILRAKIISCFVLSVKIILIHQIHTPDDVSSGQHHLLHGGGGTEGEREYLQ